MPENELDQAFKISQLLVLKHQAELDEVESKELELWLSESEANRTLYERMHQDSVREADLRLMNSFDAGPAREKAWEILGLSKTKQRSTNFYRLFAAAAAVAAITLGTWLYTSRHPEGSAATRDLLVNDIKPGSVGATLTLANGKTIKLSSATNGELAKEAGVTIKKTADGQLIYEIASVPRNDDNAPSLREGTTKQSHTSNTLATAKGETYQVKLPDGTAVWLNAASSLTYSASLTAHGKRVVRLSGEAYFQVAKDKTRPFIVESNGQKVEVMGTHFNINSYDEESSVKTTLLEGSVRINDALVLRPGQQSVISGTEPILVKEANLEEAMAWKNGDFLFGEEDFRTTMRKIARWYDVEIVYAPSAPDNLAPGGWVSRSKNISAVLKIMEATGKVHFKVEGRRITVTQ